LRERVLAAKAARRVRACFRGHLSHIVIRGDNPSSGAPPPPAKGEGKKEGAFTTMLREIFALND